MQGKYSNIASRELHITMKLYCCIVYACVYTCGYALGTVEGGWLGGWSLWRDL